MSDGVTSAERTWPTIEMCIVGYQSEAVIGNAVRSAVLVPHVQVAVCDNGPSGTTIESARQAATDRQLAFRSMALCTNPGFGAGCNALARTSEADWLMFLNPDARIITWPWGEAGPPDGHIIGAEQRSSTGRPLQAYGVGYGVIEEVRRSWLRRRSPRPHGSGFVGGGAMLVERSVFLRLGGFDEQYFLFYEDIDLCFRAVATGTTVVTEPRWEVEHDVGHSARKDMSAALLASYRSGRQFHARHQHYSRAYDIYMVMDSALRWIAHTIGRSPMNRGAYSAVFRAAVRHCVSSARSAPAKLQS